VPRVIVVDDGSTDATGANAASAGGEVLRHRSNLGKGAALRTGFQHLRGEGCAWALTLDGDGQHAPEDIPAFFACAEQTGAGLVIGNRLEHAQAMPWLRRQVNGWMSRRLSRLAGVPLADSQCGFRLVNLDAWARLPLKTAHYEIESELLVAFVRAGHQVAFVPIQVIYKSGGSKIHPVKDTWRWLRWWQQNR
jgi:glycosyltransferase involved in cell wall biosynthesis